jgi:type I restriction enzyme M protein
MPNISSIIKNVRNIMRQDRGVSGDAQRLEQLGWLLFLKILDEKDQELELIRDRYRSVIPDKFQWRNWAADAEGITGEELILFIDHPTDGLFTTLKGLKAPHAPQRAALVREVFDGSNNYMKSGYEMRKVINQLNGFDFNNSDDRHIFGTVYESILLELRDAGNKGEYYTPRAITQLMTQMTAPRLGEKVLDPAAGTGGFLSAAIDYIREKEVRTLDDEAILQKTITGWELKPVSYVLGLTNLILHGLEVPDWHYRDSLKTEYNAIGPRQQVDVILANPPFGASIADGVETNFPQSFRCRESADLFIILMVQLLKPGGRCAIVLPDGCITGDGYKERIREKLLTDCNLHTIVRLPQSTFHPATVSTNLLFFQKGTPTKEIWYYEHRLPEGQKSYSKTKSIQFDEFAPMIEWWGNREESEVAWRVNVEDLKREFDLDVRNPSRAEEEGSLSTVELLSRLQYSLSRSQELEAIPKPKIETMLLIGKSNVHDATYRFSS